MDADAEDSLREPSPVLTKLRRLSFRVRRWSPLLLMVVTYAIPLVMALVQDAWGSSGLLARLLSGLSLVMVWLLPLSAIGLCLWHLRHRRRVIECAASLLLAVPLVFVWVGSTRMVVAQYQTPHAPQTTAPASDHPDGPDAH